MSHFEFAIPLQKDELLESHAGQYHVEDVVQPRILLSKLQGMSAYIGNRLFYLHSFKYSHFNFLLLDSARAYNSEGVEYILEHFDTYFSILVHGSKLEWNVINKGNHQNIYFLYTDQNH